MPPAALDQVARRRAGMKRCAALVGLLLFAGVCVDALACRTIPPIVVPPVEQLAATSDFVFIARVEQVLPLSDEDAELVQLAFGEAPLEKPIILPNASMRISLLRTLKGAPSAHAMMQSALTNCGVVLQEGGDYLVFANDPGLSGGEILPLLGTFLFDNSPQALADLSRIESTLSLSNRQKP